MKAKTIKRMAAIILAGSMMAGMSTSAMADPQQATITKKITKEANDYAPNTTFTFLVAPGTAVDAGEGQDAIYAGPAGGVYFAEGAGTISSVPDSSDIGETTTEVGSTQISIDASVFPGPGIYRYMVTENAGTYEGVTYTGVSKNFDVYVNSEKQVYAYAFVDPSAEGGKDDGVFTNSYDVKDLTISKTVEGNQGDKTKAFSFTIRVSGADGEQYYVTFSDNREAVTVNGTSMTITLANGQTATIHGLSGTDTYTVIEDDYSRDGYLTKFDNEKTNTKSGTISGDTTVSVVNTKNATTPTGIVMDIAPYLVMILAAVVLAFVFLRKRSCTK